jgi:hypothetical protein
VGLRGKGGGWQDTGRQIRFPGRGCHGLDRASHQQTSFSTPLTTWAATPGSPRPQAVPVLHPCIVMPARRPEPGLSLLAGPKGWKSRTRTDLGGEAPKEGVSPACDDEPYLRGGGGRRAKEQW